MNTDKKPMTIPPKETPYKGYRFRSRLEARWAVFFDALGIQWEYEKEGFDLGSVGSYLPDFWLPDHDCWVEVKGAECSAEERNKIQELRNQSGKLVIIFRDIPEPNTQTDHCNYPYFDGQFDGRADFDGGGWNGELVDCNPPKNVMGIFEDKGRIIVCPMCSNDNVHIASAEYNAESFSYDDEARIDMYCEEGHKWGLCFRFGSGTTSAEIVDVTYQNFDFTLHLAANSVERRANALRAARSARFEHGETPQF